MCGARARAALILTGVRARLRVAYSCGMKAWSQMKEVYPAETEDISLTSSSPLSFSQFYSVLYSLAIHEPNQGTAQTPLSLGVNSESLEASQRLAQRVVGLHSAGAGAEEEVL